MIESNPLHPRTRIGHVHLKVSDLERAMQFYTGTLGFQVITRMGRSAAFLSAGGYHHHIALNTWESQGGAPPPAGSTGLFHFAILYPDRAELARAVRRLLDYPWPIDGAADHGPSESVYLRDPDQNGIEIYADRPRDQWPQDANGELVMYTRPLDLEGLMKEME